MEKKSSDIFLYLLGAGASCNALPLASNLTSDNKNTFANKLLEFANSLETIERQETNPLNSKGLDPDIWGAPSRKLLTAIRWLANEASNHATVDTFAKKLYFKKDIRNLKNLKVVLSAYLIAEQCRKPVDSRYDSFFASICDFDENNNVCLPPNLRILTWNYDTQLEKAFYGFCEKEDLVLKNITNNNHQIRRINGSCGRTYPGETDEFFTAVWDTAPLLAWETAVKLYIKYMDEDCQDNPDICFAWEEKERMSSSLLKNLEEVSVLIVIGYSFPYFNREIDEIIFKQFGVNLDKVYLQCPPETYDAVKNRLQRLLPPNFSDENKDTFGSIEIIPRKDTDLFFIPDEF